MIVLLFAAIMGGLATAISLATAFGLWTALALAPFGGSALALAAGLLIAARNTVPLNTGIPLDGHVDVQIAALRSMAGEGHTARGPRLAESNGSRAA
jgi:hypothetical protein